MTATSHGKDPKEIDDYLNYADERRVIISVRDFFGSGEKPTEVYFASIPGDAVQSRDEITKVLLADLYGKDGYSLEERLSIYECGASGMLQEISVEVIGGVAAPFVIYALAKLKAWITRSKSGERAAGVRNDEECLEFMKTLLERHYRATGVIRASTHVATPESVSAEFRDSRGTVYMCSVDRATGITSAKTRPKRTKA